MIEIIPNWHPLAVHFTVALLSVSIIFFIIQKPLYETEIGDNFIIFARYSLFLGVFMTVLTLIAGWDAFNSVDHDTPSHTAMLDHRWWAIITFFVFLFAAAWASFSVELKETASVAFIIYLLIAGGLLVTTGFKGADLVYKHGLGVQSLPDKSNHDHASGHDHEHGDVGSEESSHKHDDSHPHDEGHSEEHSHGDISTPEMQIDASSLEEMSQGMEATPEPEPAVTIDKDGISTQALPAEDIPMQSVEEAEAPHDDGHAH